MAKELELMGNQNTLEPLRQVVTQEHRIYADMKNLWQFYMDSYQGGWRYRQNAGGIGTGESQEQAATNYSRTGYYLYPHESESLKPYKYYNRRIRSWFDNWCRLPVNLYMKFVFSDRYPIKREFKKPELYEPYLTNANLKRQSMDRFIRNALIKTMIYGCNYILADKPPLPKGITNKEDELLLGLRAYLCNLSPLQVSNWSQNPYTHEYDWVVIKQVEYSTHDWRTYNVIADVHYWLWTKEEIYYTTSGGDLVPAHQMPIPGQPNPIPNKLGFIPLIKMTYSDIDEDGYPESFLVDIAEINRVIYNIDSEYDEELIKVAFAQLMEQRSKDDWNEWEKQKAENYRSTDTVLEYMEGTNPPQFLLPPVEALVEKRARKNELIGNIMRLANLGNNAGVTPENYQSGLAMAYSYSDMHITAAELASIAEETEYRCWELLSHYDDLPGDELIEYPKQFDVKADAEWREDFKMLKEQLNKSPSAMVKLDMQALVREIDEDDKFYDQCEKEFIEGYDLAREEDKVILKQMSLGEEEEPIEAEGFEKEQEEEIPSEEIPEEEQ